MNIEYYSLENQIKRNNDRKYIDEKKEEFKIILRNNPSSISAHWLLTKEYIDFENLPEKKPTFITDNNNKPRRSKDCLYGQQSAEDTDLRSSYYHFMLPVWLSW